MNRNLIVLVFALICFAAKAEVKDSIGIEKKDGKTFILHKVDPKETLFSVSKRYKVTVDDIKKNNPGSEAGLKVGQTLRIPYSGTVKTTTQNTTTKNTTTNTNTATNNNTTTTNQSTTKSLPASHTVEAKETWFSISKKYAITVDELKKANPGAGEALKVGQKLNLPKAKGTETQTQNTTKTEVKTQPKTEVKTEEKKVDVKKEEEDDEPNEAITPHRSVGGYNKVTEAGTAETMTTSTTNPQYLAEHRTAPVGTIIQVVNEENGQKIFVRVVSKLDAEDKSVVIRLSDKAMERLHAVDKKIKVSISYIP